MKDNGSGTDHGSGGGAFIIGDQVKGGLYSEYPSLEPGDWLNGEDLRHTFDFRGVYGTLLEQWLGLDPTRDRRRQLRAAPAVQDGRVGA